MLTALLTALGLAPKNLPQASETLGTAKATLEQVNTLFANAGLNLEQMLADPESLKAHLAALSAKDAELATALSQIETLKASATQATATIEAHTATISTAKTLFASVGFSGDLSTSKPEDFKAAFANHVKEAAALELAKVGTPPVQAIDPNAIKTGTMPRADWSKLSAKAQHEFISAGGKLTD